jgi:hypothetical protein
MLWALKSGSFLTRERVRGYSTVLLIAYAAAILVLFGTADGGLDALGRPLGADFVNVYAAGRMARQGRAAEAYDWTAHRAAEQAILGRVDVPYYSWQYPPVFLLFAVALSVLPYLCALVVYQSVTLILYLRTIGRIVDRPEVWLPALAFPGVLINVLHGHNGFLTAVLFGGGLILLDRRPLAAGALFGCLCYKPQLGLLIPLVLAVSGRWRTFAAAAATLVALTGLAWLVFGFAAFAAFSASLALTQHVVLEQGAIGFYKIQSVFAGARALGAPVGAAYGAHLLVAVVVAGTVALLWRSETAFELKAAALVVGALLATPYVIDYDLMLLAPAIAFLVAHANRTGFVPYEASLIIALWLLPLAARPLAAHGLPLVPVLLVAALALITARAGGRCALQARIQPLSVSCSCGRKRVL